MKFVWVLLLMGLFECSVMAADEVSVPVIEYVSLSKKVNAVAPDVALRCLNKSIDVGRFLLNEEGAGDNIILCPDNAFYIDRATLEEEYCNCGTYICLQLITMSGAIEGVSVNWWNDYMAWVRRLFEPKGLKDDFYHHFIPSLFNILFQFYPCGYNLEECGYSVLQCLVNGVSFEKPFRSIKQLLTFIKNIGVTAGASATVYARDVLVNRQIVLRQEDGFEGSVNDRFLSDLIAQLESRLLLPSLSNA